MSGDYKNEENDPKVIAAKAAARARVLEARSKLHPIAQAMYAVFDSLGNIIARLGCLIVVLLIIFGCIALYTPNLIDAIFKR